MKRGRFYRWSYLDAESKQVHSIHERPESQDAAPIMVGTALRKEDAVLFASSPDLLGAAEEMIEAIKADMRPAREIPRTMHAAMHLIRVIAEAKGEL